MLTTDTALGILKVIIAAQGPLPTIRTSRAQGRGEASRYAYYGAARGEIRARKSDGVLTCCSVERATSDHRVERLAIDDAKAIANREGRHWCQDIGEVSEAVAARIVSDIFRSKVA